MGQFLPKELQKCSLTLPLVCLRKNQKVQLIVSSRDYNYQVSLGVSNVAQDPKSQLMTRKADK